MKWEGILNSFSGLFLRIGLGVVFVYHGLPKIFSEGASFGFSWMPPEGGLPGVVQFLVAWLELLAGVACLLGVLTNYAALSIIVIMIGAIVTVHGKNGFSILNKGYEYNFVLILMSLALMGTGPGRFSLKK